MRHCTKEAPAGEAPAGEAPAGETKAEAEAEAEARHIPHVEIDERVGSTG